MVEKDFNTILARSFNEQGGFAYKIPDPQQGESTSSSKRPFDLFAVFGADVFFIENKFQKGYGAFNFKSSVREHQWANLSLIADQNDYVTTLIALGIWESRKFFDVLFFDVPSLLELLMMGVPSLHKKTLMALEHKRSVVEKGTIKIGDIQIIYTEDIEVLLNDQK